jgi:hypothetical protein
MPGHRRAKQGRHPVPVGGIRVEAAHEHRVQGRQVAAFGSAVKEQVMLRAPKLQPGE